MIPVTSTILFQDSLSCLADHKRNIGREFKGRFVQIFLGLKFYQNNMPSMYSGSFVTTEVLQSLLDDLYAKVLLPPNQCVLSLFEANYLSRTGMIAPGNTGPQNTWRNNFNLQKGIGCYAPPSDLSSLTFLNQDRSQCRYLQAHSSGSLAGAHCSLCPSGAGYRRESHRKWLRIDPGGNGYAVTDLQQISNFEAYVAPSRNRIPIAPLVVALYHDSDPGLVLGTRKNVTLSEFIADFNLSQEEFTAYFDDSPTHPINERLMRSAGWSSSASLGSIANAPLAQTVPDENQTARSRIPTAPILTGTPTPPPNINSGWEAEQFVEAALTADGWDAHVVARQQLGYDIFAQKGLKKLYVEVKSSLGSCSPALTAREWQQANFHKDSYVLSILENFNPTSLNTIYWIPDPANCCTATQQTSISYSISRASWASVAVPLAQI